MKADPGISAEQQYNLSCVSALCAVAVRSNAKLAPQERARLVEIHSIEALRSLKGAAMTGFFREPANRDWARKDPDLAILAERDEFRTLIAAEYNERWNMGHMGESSPAPIKLYSVRRSRAILRTVCLAQRFLE